MLSSSGDNRRGACFCRESWNSSIAFNLSSSSQPEITLARPLLTRARHVATPDSRRAPGKRHKFHPKSDNMTRSAPPSIEDDVIKVLKRMSRRPIEPTLGSDLAIDLGFDSLQILEVIAELEDQFDVSIPLNDVPSTRTVADVVAQVTALVEGRGAV
jgi:acyl carrier protein